MGKFILHKVNFFEYVPSPIHAMSYCKKLMKIAISRSEQNVAYIEIWNIKKKWFLEQKLLPVNSIEALIWHEDRLFSVGLDQLILEYNLKNGLIKKKCNSFNGSIWCACINRRLQIIAAGTDTGAIVLFDVNSELSFKHSLMKQDDPILSICWHKDYNMLVVGGKDIRVWNVDSMQMIQKISVAKEVLIWTLALTSDFTIVSGDSTGHTCFWIGKPGNLEYSKRFRSHEADIHSVGLSSDERSIHVGGVDCLMRFQLTAGNQEASSTWVMAGKMNYHTNDIRSIIYVDNMVVSAGLDCNIIVNDLLKNNITKLLPLPRFPLVHSVRAKNCVLFQHSHYLELYKLGQTNQQFEKTGMELNLMKEEEKLVKLSEATSLICCSASSNCGRYISYSTYRGTRLFYLTLDKSADLRDAVKEIGRKQLNKMASSSIIFASDSKTLVCATRSSQIKVFSIENLSLRLVNVIQSSVIRTSSPPTIMSLNCTNQILAIADAECGVHLYHILENKVHWTLPSRDASPLSLSFHFNDPHFLLIAYSDRTIIEFDMSEKAYSTWCRRFLKSSPSEWNQAKPYITRIFYNPENDDEIFAQDEDGFSIIKKRDFLFNDSKRTEKNSKASEKSSLMIIHRNIKHLLYVDVLDSNTIVTVERTPRDIMQCLPPPFKKHKFGI